jgi:two-component system sensor histidine kinase YesM
MRKFWQNISIQKKVPIVFGILLFVMITSIGICLFLYYHNTFQQYFKKSFKIAITTNANAVGEMLGNAERSVNLVNDNDKAYVTANTKNIQPIAGMIINSSSFDNSVDLRGMLDELEENRVSLGNIFNSASRYGIIVPGNYPISRYFKRWYGYGQNDFFCDVGMEQYDWYMQTLKKDGDTYWFTTDECPNQLFMAKLLKYQYYTAADGYSIRNLAIIYVGVDLKRLEEQLDIGDMPEKTHIYIVEQSGTVLYSNQKEITEQEENMIADMLQNGMESEAFYNEYTDGEYLLQKNEVADNIYMLTSIPVNDINQMSLHMLNMLFILLLIGLVIGMLFVGILSKAVVKPIMRLAKQMSLGILEQIDETGVPQNEIGVLYQGYNEMQNKIQEMLENAWESAEKQKEAELRALQAQINPHFIYNTMGTIGCEALLHGQDTIAEQLNILASIMRYSTKNPDSLVPLKAEIQFIRQYQEIQKLSHGDDIIFTFHIAASCDDVLVPKLMIQPLVENAIIHGIDLTEEGGTVDVSADIEENNLVIIVSDDGRVQDIDVINQYIHGQAEQEKQKDSLGLKNVYERITRVYGKKGNLLYAKSPEGKTQAVIMIQL